MQIGVSNPNVPIFPPRVCTLVFFIIIVTGKDATASYLYTVLVKGQGYTVYREIFVLKIFRVKNFRGV